MLGGDPDADAARDALAGLVDYLAVFGLLAEAVSTGYVPADGYAGKCQLCWEIRRHFVRKGLHLKELAPLWLYGSQ